MLFNQSELLGQFDNLKTLSKFIDQNNLIVVNFKKDPEAISHYGRRVVTASEYGQYLRNRKRSTKTKNQIHRIPKHQQTPLEIEINEDVGKTMEEEPFTDSSEIRRLTKMLEDHNNNCKPIIEKLQSDVKLYQVAYPTMIDLYGKIIRSNQSEINLLRETIIDLNNRGVDKDHPLKVEIEKIRNENELTAKSLKEQLDACSQIINVFHNMTNHIKKKVSETKLPEKNTMEIVEFYYNNEFDMMNLINSISNSLKPNPIMLSDWLKHLEEGKYSAVSWLINVLFRIMSMNSRKQ
jgi:hypothetical protein